MTTPVAGALDLERVDAAVEDAIRHGEARGLRVIGYGEITLVLGWPSEQPQVAVKRLPVFPGPQAIERYRSLVERYVSTLTDRGLQVVPTELTALGNRAYLVQPLGDPRRLLNNVLRTASPEEAGPLLRRLVEHITAAVDSSVGLDAQASNWLVEGGELRQLDLSTPMMRTPEGREELDVSLFISIYPWILRPPLKPVAHSVMAQYYDARSVIVDVASNLIKEELERTLPALLEAANEFVEPAITEDEVRRYFARDKRLWLLMQRLRRLDRSWQRTVRRRPYPFLLPPPYRYGPQELT